MTDTAAPTPTPPATKLTERERALARIAAADAAAKAALAKASAAKAAARKTLAALDTRAAAATRKAETKGKIILGALVAADPVLRAQLATKASERDREHLRSVGWL